MVRQLQIQAETIGVTQLKDVSFQCATRNRILVAHPGASWCARVAGASWFAFARMDPHLLPLILILSTASNSEAQVAAMIIAFCHKSDQY